MKQIYYVIQALIHGRGANIIKVVSLGLGLTMSILLFSRVVYEQSFDTCFKDHDKLYQLWNIWTVNGEPFPPSEFIIGAAAGGILDAMPEIVESAASTGSWPVSAPIYNGSVRFDDFKVAADSLFFQTMGIEVLSGDPVRELQQKDVIFLSKDLADKMFGGEMHTSGIAIFVPFTTKELFQDGQATYYGINMLSGNMIRANRSRLKNPNGLILGTPGAGKSFSVKREILDCFLTTPDDIIICDPEGEYYPLVSALQGQLIRIASNSEQHINPMDITIDDYLFSNPMEVIANKSDFLISLCEIIVGGRYGLSAEERSVIDKCVQRIYKDFVQNEPTVEKMPLLSDLQEQLHNEGEVALRVANSLEMFVNGSQNLFNHRTNIDMTNRIICFDIKE